MTLPSRVLGSGVSQLSTVAICGDGQDDIVAAGTSAGNATQLVAIFNSIDTSTAGSGVKLPPTEMGAVIMVANSGAHSVTVYPQTGSSINQVSSASIAKDHSSLFFAVTNTQWYSMNGTRT
jgi:hypothetical protein